MTRYNPSIRQELRYQAIPVIPPRTTESLLSWLRRTGRLQPRNIEPSQDDKIAEEIDDLIEPEYKSEDEE